MRETTAWRGQESQNSLISSWQVQDEGERRYQRVGKGLLTDRKMRGRILSRPHPLNGSQVLLRYGDTSPQ